METIKEYIELIWGLLQSLWQTVRVADVVDILIITFVIYRILSFLRKTSASSVMKGLILILFIAWIANFFNLIVLSYLMRQVLNMGIVVLIVLFQPEIRKMFEQMGTSRLNIAFWKRGRYENIETVISSVIAASEAMMEARTGALIVFEREVGLNDYAVTGTRIDANASQELIKSIFFVNSPLHDGALIVREGRLLAAACMLPMSSNMNLYRELGMRHKAGIGISERSDAVAVIISEQSGTVSVAIDGMLKRHLSGDTFEMLLKNELMTKGSRRSRRRKARKAASLEENV